MKKIFLVAAIGIACSTSHATPSIDGEYTCNDCHGFLTIKKMPGPSHKVWLGVGGGSCGGDIFVKGNFISSSNKFSIPRKNKGKVCVTEIEINGNDADIKDSCIKPEDEADSTCAVMGEYSKKP